MTDKFNLHGALYLFCSRYHSGQSSRGYRILSRLSIVGYSPGLSLQSNKFETNEQRHIYQHLVKVYKYKV